LKFFVVLELNESTVTVRRATMRSLIAPRLDE
jgi:hypothetical protein